MLTNRQVKEIHKCRVCNYKNLTPLFSLGEQYVSDFVDPDKERDGIKAPIDLVLCPNCTLVQLKHTVTPDLLYTGNYWYRSSVTQTMKDALTDVVNCALKRVKLEYEDPILDIGANDGTLLSNYKFSKHRVAVEPADNLYYPCRKHCEFIISDLWDSKHYEKLKLPKAKIITACGMLYDLDDPNTFVRSVAEVLHPEGIFVAQLMCLQNMVNVGDVGNLAHEHLEHYSLASLEFLFHKHKLEVFDIETNNVNGESYRFYVRHASGKVSVKFIQMMLQEQEAGLHRPVFYELMFNEMEENRIKLEQFVIIETQVNKKTIHVYGASTKGNVVLQYYGLDKKLIAAASERSPEKWGKVTIGTGIPIISEEESRAMKPDYYLVLPYAFLDEFIERERGWLLGGGKFIVPFPELRIVGKEALKG